MLGIILGEVGHDADTILVVAQQWACVRVSRVTVDQPVSLG
jgi:hypothetical protein